MVKQMHHRSDVECLDTSIEYMRTRTLVQDQVAIEGLSGSWSIGVLPSTAAYDAKSNFYMYL